MKIRRATIKDKKVIADFQKLMAWETENLELDEDILDVGLTSILDDPSKGKYFVAIEENEIIGCLMITPEWSDWRNGTVWWIQSVYVREDFRRKGVYTKLYQHIKDFVNSNKDYKGIRLYVEKDNSKAQEVYKAMGMDGSHYKLYEWMKA